MEFILIQYWGVHLAITRVSTVRIVIKLISVANVILHLIKLPLEKIWNQRILHPLESALGIVNAFKVILIMAVH
jgi:hypothetical protein